jgi:hypothetical protein
LHVFVIKTEIFLFVVSHDPRRGCDTPLLSCVSVDAHRQIQIPGVPKFPGHHELHINCLKICQTLVRAKADVSARNMYSCCSHPSSAAHYPSRSDGQIALQISRNLIPLFLSSYHNRKKIPVPQPLLPTPNSAAAESARRAFEMFDKDRSLRSVDVMRSEAIWPLSPLFAQRQAV